MLMLKLQRTGKKHQASFRLIVGEKRHKLKRGAQLEYLGWYSPIQNKYEFNKERVQYWLKNGAQPSDTVHNLLISAGVIEGKKIPVHKKPKAPKEASTAPAAPATAVSEAK